MKVFAASVLLSTLGVAGCVSEPETTESATPTWEEFRAETRRSFEGQDYFVISGDIGVNESELYALYTKSYGLEDGLGIAQQGSTVNRIGRRNDKWSASAALNLTYCVNNSFGNLKSRVVSELASATASWEAVARVNFTYVSSEDGNCTGRNRNVTFAVRPYSDGGACAFFPSGGGCVARTLVIDFNDLDNNPVYEEESPNVRTVGVFRHELGHILGLRHEHTRRESGTCFEDSSWRALTAYDRNSVMHYPWCNGNTDSDLSITASDRAGVQALYGRP